MRYQTLIRCLFCGAQHLAPGKVGLVSLGDLVEGHRRDHRRVSQRLQVHVAAGLGALQFDDQEPALAVRRESVGPWAGRSLRIAQAAALTTVAGPRSVPGRVELCPSVLITQRSQVHVRNSGA